MNIKQDISRFALGLTSLVILAALSACGGSDGFNPKTSKAKPADAYLTAPAAGGSGSAIAPTTTASIVTGLYSPQAVTLTCADASGSGCLATYYTIDGTTPGRASTAYTGPIPLWSKTTVKYFSIDKAGNIEAVKTQNYLIGSIDIKGIKSIAAGWNHTLGLKNDGTLWAWGGNGSGQLGDGTVADRTKPVQIGTDTNWSVLSAGKTFSIALKTDGTLWAWGINSNGQLGDGSIVDKSAPVQIGTDNKWSAISAGDSFSLALKSDGTLWTWGSNSKGQLGLGTITDGLAPVQVGAGTAWTAIAAGYDHAAALRNDGTLWAWGGNESGQLGQGAAADHISPAVLSSHVPVQVPGTNWSAVTAGGSSQSYLVNISGIDVLRVGGYTVALKSDGTLWAWGENIHGQLGDGTNYNMAWGGAGTYPLNGHEANDRLVPNQIGTDTDWSSISTGAGHSVALKSDGTLWAWGLNVNGQLANGNPGMNNLMPLPVGADTYLPYILPKQPWTAISAGGYQTLALRGDGTLWAWGWNGSGQLGDGTKSSSGGGSDPLQPTWKLPKYSFVVSNKVYSYTIDYDVGSGSGPNTGSGELTSTGLLPVAAGAAPVAEALDPSGRFLYVIDSAVKTVEGEKVSYIHTFAVDKATGGLTEVGDPTGVKTLSPTLDSNGNLVAPQSITVDPLGKFVYVVGIHSKGWRTVAVYTIDPVTGELTCTGTGSKGAKAIVVEPQGRYAYTLRDVGITGYTIDQRTGMLSSLVAPCDYDYCDDNEDNAEVYISAGQHLKVDLSGQFLYLARSSPAEIRVYSINQASGRIYDTNTPQAQPAVSAMVISPPGRSTVTGVGLDAHTQLMYLLYNNNLNGLTLNQITGQVTGVGIESAVNALGAETDPTGKYVYVFSAGAVHGHAIDPGSGKTQVVGPQTSPTQMATNAGAAGTLRDIVFASY